jgi:hypothetical protein
VLLQLADATGELHEVALEVEIRGCRESEGSYLVGATISAIDAESRLRLMEWCYVVCSHERLRGHRPGVVEPAADAIVIPLDAPLPQPVPA